MKKQLKSMLVLLIVFSVIMSIMPVFSLASTSKYLTISNETGAVGDTVTVEIKAAKDIETDSINLETSFDSSELETSNKDITLITTSAFVDGGVVGEQVNLGIAAGDPVKITAGTTLISIKFKILKPGEHTISSYFEIENSETDLEDTDNVTATVTGTQEATGITLSKTSTTIEQGKTDSITATVTPEGATDKSVTWSSSDMSVATVSNGTISAVAKGTATITASTSNGKEATCQVTVTQPITGVTLNKTKLELEKGASEKLTATVTPSNADGDKTISWKSSDTSKVTVSSDGTVQAVEKGSATITAETANGKTATCNVTVGVPLKSIALNETNKTLKNGESFELTVVYSPEDTDAEKTVTWTSSDTSIATVDENGKVTAVSCTGTATITATANADSTKTATATIVTAHKDDKLTLHSEKKATCTEAGNKAYYSCSGCDNWFEDDTGSVKIDDKSSVTVPIDLTAHDWDEGTITTAPDCTNKGIKTYICKNDKSHTRTEDVSPKGHAMETIPAKSATCEGNGNIEYYKCSVCNKLYKDATGSVEISLEETVEKATGHDWGDWEETTPATTTSEGEETRICKNDSSHVETRVIPKIHVHELTKTDAKDATCVADGNIEYWTCSVCGKTFSDNEGKNEVEDVVIPKDENAHDWGEWTTTKEPSCTEEGSKERVCKLDESHKETESIAKKPHNLTKVDAVKATCETDGNKEYYKCSECDKYFEDSTGVSEITDKSSVIIKASHNLTKTERKEATCVSEGNIEYWTCSVCEKKYSDNEGKNEVEDVVIPINEDAHDWEDWVILKDATVDEEGSRTRACKNHSEHIELETIARLPYIIEFGNGQTHEIETDKELTIQANGTLEKLVALLVDGKELDEDNYSLASGSTIATLKTEYLDTLEEGDHTLTFVYNDGQVTANFKVAKKAVDPAVVAEEENNSTSDSNSNVVTSNNTQTTVRSSSPRTGDSIFTWISLLIISVVGVVATAKFTKKKDIE